MGELGAISIHELSARYEGMYTYLYKTNVLPPNYWAAVAAFVRWSEGNPPLLRRFVKRRGAKIETDREAAAFVYAMASMRAA